MLASPSFSQFILDLSLDIVLSREESTSECFLRLLRSHNSLGWRGLLSWAISSWWTIYFARSNWDLKWPNFFWLQLCNPLAVALSFKARVSSGQVLGCTVSQASFTTSRKPSREGQKASKWNLFLQPMISCSPRIRGQWSESLKAAHCRRQPGN